MATTARIRNWSEYNRALVNRGSLLFDFAPDYLTQLTYQGTQVRGGMVRYSAQMYEFLLTIKVLLRLPWRASVGFAHGLLSKAFPEATVSVPHYAHASRMAAQLPLKIKTLGLTATQGLVLAFDSTGVHVYTGSGWHQRKYGKTAKCKRRDSWKKIHLGLDLTTQQIVAMAYTDSNHNDCEMIPQLGQAITGKVTEFIADGAYDTRACYQMTTRWQAKAIIPPDCRAKMQVQLKSPRTYQSYLAQRDQTLQEIQRSHTFQQGLKRWKVRHRYHRRSLIETCMFRFKRIFGFHLHHQTVNGRINETIAKINALNLMTTLGMPQYH